MKVLASTLAGLALSQDRWTGFDYDYGFGSAERNQISQSNVANIPYGQGAGTNAAGDAITTSNTLGPLFNPYSGNGDQNGLAFPTYLGNGMMCWHCDADSVYNCFNSGQFQVCHGQDYFCYFHERRKIGHYFNRREKYIDNYDSLNTDLFLVRVNNEAWNLDNKHYPNNTRNPSVQDENDHDRPKTDIHVMAGCQQPQACLRQQMQNQAINIGIAFYGTESREVGNLHVAAAAGTNNSATDFTTYIHPTSRRNVREGLCRLGKDWTYYAGKLWHYDDGGQYHASIDKQSDGTACTPVGTPGADHFVPDMNDRDKEANCLYTINTIDRVNSVPIHHVTNNLSPMDAATANSSDGEATAVFGRNGSIPSTLLWGRGIYDASDAHGHQFWHERESWYNGMRPNGFPDQHYHGGKGTESVCHFCCNPASSDGMFCNRRLLDNTSAEPLQGGTSGAFYGVQFADGSGNWFKLDPSQAWDGTNADQRSLFVDPDLVRADDPDLNILHTPMANSYNTNAAWLSEHRFHGMFRNPETQVSQDFLDPYIAG